jgi:hypothetical protein
MRRHRRGEARALNARAEIRCIKAKEQATVSLPCSSAEM